jgi:hypothetical protein
VDGDGVIGAFDNCRTISNVDQADADSDGAGDVCDNCLNVQNGPLASPLSLVPQCDSDSDGFGNVCDGDLNGDGFVSGSTDNAIFFRSLEQYFVPPADSRADMNCDGSVSGIGDGVLYLGTLRSFFPGPSGYACAGTIPCTAPTP